MFHRKWLGCTTVAALAAQFSVLALAQEATTPAAQQLEEIIVTGTNIRGADRKSVV